MLVVAGKCASEAVVFGRLVLALSLLGEDCGELLQQQVLGRAGQAQLLPPGEVLQGVAGLLQVQGVQRGGGGQRPVPAEQAHGVGPDHAVQGARLAMAEAGWPLCHLPGLRAAGRQEAGLQ